MSEVFFFLNENKLLGIIWFFCLGGIIGSFLNVCILRWPEEKSVCYPLSNCPKCHKMIKWYDNIPIISYFILKGQCRNCQNKISKQYWIIELITAILFSITYYYVGISALLFPYLFFIACSLIATIVDFRYKIIPDQVTVGGMIIGLIWSFFVPELHNVSLISDGWMNNFEALGYSLKGILIGGGILYCVAWIAEKILKKEAMGGGDIKLLAMIGSLFGWKIAVMAFWIAPFFGLISGIIEKIKTGKNEIAYGPFLILGAFIALIFKEEIVNWFMQTYYIY